MVPIQNMLKPHKNPLNMALLTIVKSIKNGIVKP